MFWNTDPSTLDPSTLRGMSGQVLRMKGYYDVMIHKHHCEDVYYLIDLRVGKYFKLSMYNFLFFQTNLASAKVRIFFFVFPFEH